jgi:hypothetical protein
MQHIWDDGVIIFGMKWLYNKFAAFNTGYQADIDSSVIRELKSDYNLFVQPYIELQEGYRFLTVSLQFGCQINVHAYECS